MTVRVLVLAAAMLSVMAGKTLAQEPIPYGAPITLEQARKVAAAAEAEAVKQKWPVAIAIVDSSGYLVSFTRLDNTQLGSIDIAKEKARCSALFRRPTKAFEDALKMGGENLRILKAPGILPIEGGLPILVEGKIIGAIGVSGVKSFEDAVVALAGVNALKPRP
jgi:glc operon protein GlcG